MNTTVTSADLGTMAARLPDVAASRKLRLFDALYLNQPEVTIDGESVSIDEAIEVALLTGAPFVSMNMDIFDPAELLAQVSENVPEGSPSDENLKRLVRSVARYKGENEGLWLRWAAQGLTYEWSATADWRRKLARDMARADFEGKQESAIQAQAQSSRIDAVMALLVDSQEFRATQPTKRNPVGFVIASASELEADEHIIGPAVSRASTEVDRRVLQLEMSLKPQLESLAEELRKTPSWRAATSIPKHHDAAITFLMGKAEGFRLSSRISEPLMRVAKELDATNAIKVTFVPQK